jgi:hypothetical protein
VFLHGRIFLFPDSGLCRGKAANDNTRFRPASEVKKSCNLEAVAAIPMAMFFIDNGLLLT